MKTEILNGILSEVEKDINTENGKGLVMNLYSPSQERFYFYYFPENCLIIEPMENSNDDSLNVTTVTKSENPDLPPIEKEEMVELSDIETFIYRWIVENF